MKTLTKKVKQQMPQSLQLENEGLRSGDDITHAWFRSDAFNAATPPGAEASRPGLRLLCHIESFSLPRVRTQRSLLTHHTAVVMML